MNQFIKFKPISSGNKLLFAQMKRASKKLSLRNLYPTIRSLSSIPLMLKRFR